MTNPLRNNSSDPIENDFARITFDEISVISNAYLKKVGNAIAKSKNLNRLHISLPTSNFDVNKMHWSEFLETIATNYYIKIFSFDAGDIDNFDFRVDSASSLSQLFENDNALRIISLKGLGEAEAMEIATALSKRRGNRLEKIELHGVAFFKTFLKTLVEENPEAIPETIAFKDVGDISIDDMFMFLRDFSNHFNKLDFSSSNLDPEDFQKMMDALDQLGRSLDFVPVNVPVAVLANVPVNAPVNDATGVSILQIILYTVGLVVTILRIIIYILGLFVIGAATICYFYHLIDHDMQMGIWEAFPPEEVFSALKAKVVSVKEFFSNSTHLSEDL